MTEADYGGIEAETRKQLIDAYWDRVLERIAFLDRLVDQGRYPEALTLCLVYLDGVAHSLAGPSEQNGVAFTAALIAHETVPFFALIHPLQAIRETGKMKGFWPDISHRISTVYPGPVYPLLNEADFLGSVSGMLSVGELKALGRQLWKGTLAGVVYTWMRNPAVHELGGANTIGFSATTLGGKPVSTLSLQDLKPVLKSMLEAARAKSHATGQWP